MSARPLSRRGLVVGLAAAPLAALPANALTVSAISPELAQLIRRSARANERVRLEGEADRYPPAARRAAGVFRLQVASFPSAGLPDVLAKAAHIEAIWGDGGMQGELDAQTSEGACYLDTMALAVALDLAKLAHAFPILSA